MEEPILITKTDVSHTRHVIVDAMAIGSVQLLTQLTPAPEVEEDNWLLLTIAVVAPVS